MQISLIVPFYNTEKFLPLLFESILEQTFQDFEVVAVDDCSKDNSVKVVESFLPVLGERLKIIRREKNSGSPGTPRNDGIKIAQGKYIAFADSDDMLMTDALQELFDAAEKTQADIVHTERYFQFIDSESKNLSADNIELGNFEIPPFVEKLTFETDNITNRVRRFCNKKTFWVPWGKLFRRDFLLENNLTFPAIHNCEDFIFHFQCLCLAKKYVRIPNITYIYRKDRKNSASHVDTDNERLIKLWLDIVVDGVNILNDFMDSQKIFQNDNQLRYNVTDFYMMLNLNSIMEFFLLVDSNELARIIFESLRKKNCDCYRVFAHLISWLKRGAMGKMN